MTDIIITIVAAIFLGVLIMRHMELRKEFERLSMRVLTIEAYILSQSNSKISDEKDI